MLVYGIIITPSDNLYFDEFFYLRVKSYGFGIYISL